MLIVHPKVSVEWNICAGSHCILTMRRKPGIYASKTAILLSDTFKNLISNVPNVTVIKFMIKDVVMLTALRRLAKIRRLRRLTTVRVVAASVTKLWTSPMKKDEKFYLAIATVSKR